MITHAGTRGGATGQSNGTGANVNLGANGSLIQRWAILVMNLAYDNSGSGGVAPTFVITDPRGNTWTQLTASLNNAGGAANTGTVARQAWCRVETTYQDNDVIQVAFSGITFGRITQVEEFRGVVRVGSPIGAESGQIGTGTTPAAALSNVPDGEAVIAVVAVEGPIEDGFTQDSDTTNGPWVGLTRRGGSNPTPTNVQTMNTAYKIVDGPTPFVQTYNPTLGVSRDWAERILRLLPVTDVTGSFTASLPAITSTWAAENDVESDLTGTLPGPVTAEFEGEAAFLDGALVAVLPALDADLTGQQPDAIGADMAAELPVVEAFFSAQRPGAAFMDVALPAITGQFVLERTGTDGLVDIRPRRRTLHAYTLPVRWPPTRRRY